MNAIADHEVYRTGDLTAEPRWPVFAPAAAHATTPLDRDEAGRSPAETVREVMSISLACSVIPGRDQSAVHDRDRIHPSLPGRGRRQQRPNRVDRPMRRGMRHPNNGPIWRIVRFVRQYVATGNTRSSSGNADCRPGPVNGAIRSGRDAVITCTTPT